MSWFFIYKGKDEKLKNEVHKYFAKYNYAEVYNAYVYFEGRDQTLTHCFNESGINFIVSGLGILKKDEFKLADVNEWKELVDSKKFVQELNGHFAGCIIQDGLITCFNDGLGLREVYYVKLDDGILVSSRADLLSRFIENKTPAYDYIAGNWFTSVPLFYKTFTEQIKRLGPGGILEVHQLNEPQVTNRKFTAHESNIEIVRELLNKFSRFPLSTHKLSLGLSGGLDSRILLALLSGSGQKNWRVHTFGSGGMKDVLIAEEIAARLNLRHIVFNRTHFNINEILEWINKFLPFTGLTIPISDFLHLYYHKLIDDYGYMIIDGAFGEIGRRQYLNRFRVNGAEVIKGKDTAALLDNMRMQKADIFDDSVKDEMLKALRESTEIVWKEMDGVSTKDAYYWIDKLMVRYKPSNVFNYGQHCLDQMITAYMPFAQEELLENILRLPLKVKRNGRFFRSIIKEENPELTKISLVKDHIAYPYSLGTVTSYAWRKMKYKLSKITRVDPVKYYMFDELKEYIYDELNSRQAKESNFIDRNKILHAADSYYKGDKTYLNDLDWWLTFHEWYKINFSNNY